MPTPSLQDLCKKACIKNINSLTDVGDFQYDQIAEILSYVRSPEQLHSIEKLSPQIKGMDADLWQKFIARDVPKWATKNYAPKNPSKWYQVYKRYKREQEEEIRRDEEILRQSMMGIKKARDDNLSKVVELGSLPKLPRDPRMLANNGGVPLGRSGQRKENSSLMVFAKGSKTKMIDGKSVLTRARREAKEIAQMGKLSRPTHQLTIGHVNRAPAAMVKEYRTANQPALKILSRRATINKIPEIENATLEERERRLNAIHSGSKVDGTQPQFVDSEDDSDGDELFGEPPSSPKSQCQRPILATKKTTDIKQPSNVISALTSKLNTNSRFVTRKMNNTISTPPQTKHSLPGQEKNPTWDDKISKPMSLSSSKPQIPLSSPAGDSKPIISMRRKQVDIFNRGASKRPRSG